MTYVVRIVNPTTPGGQEPWIGHGELAELVGNIFRDRAVKFDKVKVEWEDAGPDPFHGQRAEMVRWLNATVANNIDLENLGRYMTTVNLARLVREEWIRRGYDIRLTQYVEVARQVAAGWKE
jgi:hypothetical protein